MLAVVERKAGGLIDRCGPCTGVRVDRLSSVELQLWFPGSAPMLGGAAAAAVGRYPYRLKLMHCTYRVISASFW